MKYRATCATSWGSNSVYCFGIGADRQMYYKSWNGQSWQPSATGWSPLGGLFDSAPAVASWGTNRLDVFCLGSDNQMWHRAWDGTAWLPPKWEALGGTFNSPPSVASWGPKRLDVFALGTDNQMYHKAWGGNGAWLPSQSGWDALGGTFNTEPAVAAWGPNRLDVFAVGTDNQMYHKAWNGTAWLPSVTGWDALGGAFGSAPTVASFGDNLLDIFAIGTDGLIYHKAWNGSQWTPSMTGWDQWGPATAGEPYDSMPAAISFVPNGHTPLALCVLGSADQMCNTVGGRNIPWSPLNPIGGTFECAPALASWGPERLDVFGLGTDNQMYHKALTLTATTADQWSPPSTEWEALGGVFMLPRPTQTVPPPPPPPPPSEMEWTGNVYFMDSMPLGGSYDLKIDNTGAFWFSGHMHDSGFDPLAFQIAVFVVGASGNVYAFGTQGSCAGTISLIGGGSRDYNWDGTPTSSFKDENGNSLPDPNPVVQQNWADIAQGTVTWQINAQDQLVQDIGAWLMQALQSFISSAGAAAAKALVAAL